MTSAGTALGAVLEGLALAVQYNPLAAAVTAALAAGLSGHPRARSENRQWAVLVLVGGWLVGDGLRVLGRARDIYDGIGAAGAGHVANWTVPAVWAAGSLVIGYALPALAGAAVGRRVTHGTGWLAAAGVASALTLAVSAAIGALS
ncbi:MAG: hypothetical protein JXA36_03935 [Coriobacteriia bacterium]|nr:hypothetical protein [Coriobacteriia bacterium]